jgi:hypothetical protein
LILPGLQPRLLILITDVLADRPVLSSSVVLLCLLLAIPLLAGLLFRRPMGLPGRPPVEPVG